MIDLGVVLVSAHVLALDEGLDPFLQVHRLHRESQLVVELRDEEVVRERLPHLHYPHHGSVDLVLTVLEDLLLRLAMLGFLKKFICWS